MPHNLCTTAVYSQLQGRLARPHLRYRRRAADDACCQNHLLSVENGTAQHSVVKKVRTQRLRALRLKATCTPFCMSVWYIYLREHNAYATDNIGLILIRTFTTDISLHCTNLTAKQRERNFRLLTCQFYGMRVNPQNYGGVNTPTHI